MFLWILYVLDWSFFHSLLLGLVNNSLTTRGNHTCVSFSIKAFLFGPGRTFCKEAQKIWATQFKIFAFTMGLSVQTNIGFSIIQTQPNKQSPLNHLNFRTFNMKSPHNPYNSSLKHSLFYSTSCFENMTLFVIDDYFLSSY